MITPKQRFEVLRRCNFTCQYCGRSAPEVTLEVDHFDPKVNGGNDAPGNLVAACRDCNAGKSGGRQDIPEAQLSPFIAWLCALDERQACRTNPRFGWAFVKLVRAAARKRPQLFVFNPDGEHDSLRDHIVASIDDEKDLGTAPGSCRHFFNAFWHRYCHS